jgi:hypothetical protein
MRMCMQGKMQMSRMKRNTLEMVKMQKRKKMRLRLKKKTVASHATAALLTRVVDTFAT